MSIFIILTLTAYDFIIQGFKNTLIGSEQEEAVQNARKASGIVIDELRTAKKSDMGDYIFETVATNTISFYSNVDTDAATEKIRYFLSGTELKRGEIKPTGTPLQYSSGNETFSTIAKYLNNQALPIFTYYDTNNNLIANPGAYIGLIRLVHVSLKINVTPQTAPADYFVDSNIQIRNLKDNL